MLHLAEEKRFIPPLIEKILVARRINFSAETKFSGIEFIPNKIMALDKELQEEAIAIHKFEHGNGEESGSTTNDNATSRVAKILLELDKRNEKVRILKGSVDAVLKLVTHVNEAEVKWKAQEISKSGSTPLLVSINDEAIGLVGLKDNLKENICQKLDEVRSTGITTVMLTGDNQLTAQVIAKEANVDQVMAEAKPTDKLTRVEEEQIKGHVIGMVGDGTNDAPA